MASEQFGPAFCTLGDESFLLESPTPELLSGMFDVIMQEANTRESALGMVKKQLEGLPPELAKEAVKYAIDVDARAARAARTEAPTVPKGELLNPRVCAKLLHLMALKHQPTLTLARCEEIVAKLTPVFVVAQMGMAFPDVPAKKSPDSSSSSAAGGAPTGQPYSPSVAAALRRAGLPET